MLFNLISNAAKFTDEGSITVKIASVAHCSASHAGSEEGLLFEVKDTGLGMSKEIQDKLFKKFSTFDQKGHNSGGVGLGLFISQNIVQQIGMAGNDQINVFSAIGVGSTFRFEVKKHLYERRRKINNMLF